MGLLYGDSNLCTYGPRMGCHRTCGLDLRCDLALGKKEETRRHSFNRLGSQIGCCMLNANEI
jgi:hypothetical protein